MLHGPSTTSAESTPASSFFARLHSGSRSVSYDESTTDNTLSDGVVVGGDVRRAQSLRVSRLVNSRRDVAGLSSFAAAGSTLTSPALSPSHYTPPAASRHALFSHHAERPVEGSSSFSDPGPFVSSPPSPTSSGAFSPASAFLSHFSSSNSLRTPALIPPDAQGARVLDYTLGKVLGRGGFSTVRLATHIVTGETLACKIVKRDDLSDRSGSVEKFEDEIRIWSELPRHPSLLPLLEMHRTPTMTFLITPFLPGGNLLDVIRREGGSPKTASKWFPGVVAAVAAMHEGFEGFTGGLLHGDLKLDNFLVDHAGKVMVCDFYMAQTVEHEPTPTIPPPIGNLATIPKHFHRGPRMSSPLPAARTHTPHEPLTLSTQPFPSASLPYAPPELLRAPPSGPSLAQDIWALGVILHALLTGRLPFVDAFDPRLQMKILRGIWEEPSHLGKEWLECLRGCLDGNKHTRWDIRRVRESDAMAGWHEVKPRSKSRSRSRVRRRPSDRSLGGDYSDPSILHADPLTSLPQPIPSRRRPLSREPPPLPRTVPSDLQMDLFAPGEPGRSRSASGSRSRSSGRGHVFSFSPPEMKRFGGEDVLANRFDSISITRGRSPAKQVGDTLSLSFSRQPSQLALGQYENSSHDTPRRSRRTSLSPSVSRSRSRASPTEGSPAQEEFMLGFTPVRELGVVSEERRGGEDDRAGRSLEQGERGRWGRSRSRGGIATGGGFG
ncbi:kinase-like domain-containing protein [Naematelia encephala]|uniref:Kinase-like domain-containing protein n=1 Tax=Naematelia encephala TaxID=71784 RepID=A0A1Y2BJG2_9TREE|nr:kinase-like domain-containing protein [Naematelia encephala]